MKNLSSHIIEFRSGSLKFWILMPVLVLFLSKGFVGDTFDSLKNVAMELTESADHESGDNNEEKEYSGDQDEFIRAYHMIDCRLSQAISLMDHTSGAITVHYFDIHTPPPERI